MDCGFSRLAAVAPATLRRGKAFEIGPDGVIVSEGGIAGLWFRSSHQTGAMEILKKASVKSSLSCAERRQGERPLGHPLERLPEGSGAILSSR